MLISAGDQIHGYKIVEYKDIVFGIASSSEGGGFRQLALKKMAESASKLGATAVINFKMEIYPITGSVQEATAYGNAVIADPLEGTIQHQDRHQVKLESFIPKAKNPETPIAKVQSVGDYKFVVCPKCGTKYKVETNEKGELHIKGFDDVDDDEPGLQIFCLRCGTKFTVPE